MCVRGSQPTDCPIWVASAARAAPPTHHLTIQGGWSTGVCTTPQLSSQVPPPKAFVFLRRPLVPSWPYTQCALDAKHASACVCSAGGVTSNLSVHLPTAHFQRRAVPGPLLSTSRTNTENCSRRLLTIERAQLPIALSVRCVWWLLLEAGGNRPCHTSWGGVVMILLLLRRPPANYNLAGLTTKRGEWAASARQAGGRAAAAWCSVGTNDDNDNNQNGVS